MAVGLERGQPDRLHAQGAAGTFLSHRRLRRSAEWPAQDLPERVVHAPDHGTRLDLLAALRRLPPQDRAVLVLRYWEDLSVARTAELLGIREGTCRVRAVRALERLRAHLPDLADPDPDLHHDSEDPS